MNYETIKETAKQHGVPVKDFLVLSPNNDPFYVGSPGQMDKARWFKEIYAKMGSPRDCHIRRVHYWLVSQEPKYKKPGTDARQAELAQRLKKGECKQGYYDQEMDKTVYMNTLNDWGYLTLSAKYARYAQLVPTGNIVDRRNPEPHVNAHHWRNENPSEIKDSIDAEEIISTIARKFYCFNASNTQPYLMEMWCEKSTMNDVLEPIAQRYGMNLVTGLGELSITAVHQLIQRVNEADKPVRIFYISDFDPAGECMPVSVARKIEFFIREHDSDADVKLRQIMLTREQCQKFKLPRTPIKPTERRKAGFEERHGAGATELDALEALHPGEMKKMILGIVSEYFDTDAWNEASTKNQELRDKVEKFLTGKITDVLAELDVSEFDDVEIETGESIDDTDKEWIYDAMLDYDEQIEKYKRFQGRD